LSGAVTTLPNALPSITKSKRRSSLSIVTGDVKQNHFLTYKQIIWACNVVAEVFELLANNTGGYENLLLTDTTCVTINGNGEDTFHVKRSALFGEPTCDDEGE
jgi:hypothetical protein